MARAIRWRWLGLLILMACCSQAYAEGTDRSPVAVLTGFSGGVTVASGQTQPSAAVLGMNLYDNDHLVLAKAAQVTLLYQDGQIVTIRGSEQPTLTVTKETYRGPGAQRVAVARGAQDSMGAIFETRSRGVNTADLKYENLRKGPQDEPLEEYPRECAILASSPTFMWRAAAGREYRVLVSKEGAANPLVDARAKGGTYQFPGTLDAATNYLWKVVPAGSNAYEYFEVGFSTLPADQARAVVEARDNLQTSVADPPTRTLLLGLLYKHNALYGDAIRSFSALSAMQPSNSYFHEELAWLYFQVGNKRKSKDEFELAHKRS